MNYYHIYTKGLEDRQLFRDDDDFVAAMNLIAVAFFGVSIEIWAFVLMSNHVHFVIRAHQDQAEKFISLYKNLLSRYLRSRYNEAKALRHLKTSIDLVDPSIDNIKRLIAYILNNPVKAGINCVPQGYEWSSARCYFNLMDSRSDTVPISEFSVREQRRVLHSYSRLPATCRVNSKGYVTPQSYVNSIAVERLFKSSRTFEFFLSSSLSIRKGISENITFNDSTLNIAMRELLEKKFDVDSINELDDFLKKNILKDLKSRFSASSKQLARISGLSVNEVIRYLD